MTPNPDRTALEEKGKALRRGLLIEFEGDLQDALLRLCLAVAWLTSVRKENREKAKARIREWVRLGTIPEFDGPAVAARLRALQEKSP